MPSLVVNLTPDLDDFVLTSVESGRYESPSELMRVALLALHSQEQSAEKQKRARSIADADVFRKLWDISAHTHPIVGNPAGAASEA
jgi:putative addiction module CopG family antidote